jgi:hypothetical protein
MDVSVNNHHLHEIFQLLLEFFGDQNLKAIIHLALLKGLSEGTSLKIGTGLGGKRGQGKSKLKNTL